jgi:hypothetical protein
MKKSKLFSLVDTFDNSDWTYTSDHVKQRHESNTEISTLYGHLHAYRKKLDHEDLSLDNTLQLLYPSKPRKYLQNVMSKLYALLLSALAEKEFHQNEDLKRLTQFEVLQRRRLFSFADKLAEASKQHLHDDSKIDLWKGYYDFRLRYLRLISNHPNNISKPDRIEFIDDLIYSIQLSTSTLAKFLQVELVNLSRLNEIEYKTQLAAVIGLIGSQENELKVHRILDDLLKLVDPKQHVDPQFLFETLMNESHILSTTLSTVLYILLRVFYLSEARKGNRKYNNELAKIIHWSAKNRGGSNSISPNTFLTDINILCYLEATEDAVRYVEAYHMYIEKNMRNQVKELSLMMIDFSSGDLDQALFRYNTTAIKKTSIKMIGYNIMLKCVYELNYEIEEISDRMRNVTTFLKRNKSKLHPGLLTFYSNFLIGYKYLLYDLKKLPDYLNSDIPIKDRHWLKEKMLEK